MLEIAHPEIKITNRISSSKLFFGNCNLEIETINFPQKWQTLYWVTKNFLKA